MAAAPKCKLCGERHWSWEGHKFAKETVVPVTKPDSQPAALVTKAVRERSPVTKLGRPKRYASNAERQTAYRRRRDDGKGPT